MIANYHTHTSRCRHATGSEEEYVRCAIDRGINILGFSDHTPYCFPEGYYSHMRMYPNELTDYVRTVEELGKQYAGEISILLGVEMEYYPAYFGETVQMLRDAGIEYMLLGQHWIGNEIKEPYNGRPTADIEHLTRYCHQLMEAMNTGLFSYVAHPDLLYFTGENEIYETHIREVCREANSCGIPLEINLLGIRDKRHYPNDALWRVAAEERCKVVLGSDAHEPKELCCREDEKKALEIVRNYDLELLETVPLRRM